MKNPFNFQLSIINFNKLSIIPKRTLAILALIGTAFGYSVLNLNTRILAIGFAPMTQVYVRVGFGFLLSLIVFRREINIKKFKKIPKSDWFWLSMMGVVGYAACVWFATLAALNTKLVNAAVIGATGPFIVYIYSFFLLKEKIRPRILGLLFIALYGISVISARSFVPAISGFGIGELFALLSVAALGFWSIGIKKLSNYLQPKEITIIVMGIAMLSSMFIALLRGEPLDLHSFTMPSIWLGIAIGAGLNFGLTFLENFAFKNIDVVFGNQLLMLSTIFSMINGYLFYQELVTFPEFVGGLLIVISVLGANKILKTK